VSRALTAVAAALAVLACLPAAAQACSKDDAAYFDGFPDASCLATLQNTEIDTFGGLRLVTDGAVTDAVWDTDAHFTSGVPYEAKTFTPLPGGSLTVADTGAPAKLTLPASHLPLTPAGAPNLLPTASTWRDSDSVSDPAVVKADATYVLFYAAVAEDGTGPAIFRLTSSNGTSFTRPADAAQHTPVLTGTPGEFDENGVYGPDVVYDPAGGSAKYKMWFTGRGDTFDQIGYATSADGITWTKREDPVLAVGLPGSQDSFSAAHPSVLFDSGLWKMWYEGDDSTKKSIAYATSTDGIAWSKAGAVIESGTGNVEFGVFAPTVWKEGDTFQMLVGGRKETNNELQTKLIAAHSANGLDWTLANIALNTGGFASSNLSSPEVLVDANAIKLYYSGNRENEGDARDRIGYAAGTGGTASAQPMLDLAPRSTTIFDAREVSGVAASRPGGNPDDQAGVYWALNEDGIPRLGAAHSADGQTWIKDPGPAEKGSLLAYGPANQFDEDGQKEPNLYHETRPADFDYFLYFTGVNDGVRTIGYSTAEETPVTLMPDHATWTDSAALLAPGAGGTFDDLGMSHPSLVRFAAGSYGLYYTSTGSAAGTGIARVVSSSPTAGFGSRSPLVFTGEATCDPDGRRDPVATADSVTNVDLYYVGIDDVDTDGDGTTDETIERTCSAHSTDGLTFARTGTLLNPSQVPFAADEVGALPASIDKAGNQVRLYTTVVGRDGRMRGSSAVATVPAPAGGTVPSAWASYQLGDESTPERDFRFIEGVSTGAVELWMSVLQPYSDANTSYWSDYFPVDAAAVKEDLNFLLTISGVRWQARLRRTDVVPTLDKVTIGVAPIHFPAIGTATTTDVAPPADFALQSWTNMTVVSELFAPLGTGTGGGTVTVLDPEGNTLVAATAITVPGENVVPLSGINAAAEPRLRVKLDLTSATGQATPVVRELKVAYAALQPGATPTPTPTPTPSPTPTPTPPPPPPAVLTLAAAPKTITYGRTSTLSGRLSVGAAGVANRTVAILQQPVGSTAPKPLTTVTTDATGAFTTPVKPTKKTTYSLALAGVTSPAPVTVSVKHALSLKVTMKGRRATFSGRIGPRHASRTVTIQRKRGTRWVRYARLKTTRRSTYTLSRRLAKGRHQFRAITAADRDHLAGRSPARRVRAGEGRAPAASDGGGATPDRAREASLGLGDAIHIGRAAHEARRRALDHHAHLGPLPQEAAGAVLKRRRGGSARHGEPARRTRQIRHGFPLPLILYATARMTSGGLRSMRNYGHSGGTDSLPSPPARHEG
jgi:predicted GH43/DUF377 family glycosyl hydrolase